MGRNAAFWSSALGPIDEAQFGKFRLGRRAVEHGRDGVLHATGHHSSYRLLPDDRRRKARRPEPTLPRSGSHEREWLAACRGGPAAMSNFGYGGVLTELVLLGNIASQFDRAIEFDLPAMTCPGDNEAAAQLVRVYRSGWSLL